MVVLGAHLVPYVVAYFFPPNAPLFFISNYRKKNDSHTRFIYAYIHTRAHIFRPLIMK